MPRVKSTSKFTIAASALALLIGATSFTMPKAVQAAVVYDPTNHVQNVLQAARALEQIRIQSEQLTAQIRALAKSPYDHSKEIGQAMAALDDLGQQARGLATTVRGLDRQFSELYPENGAARSAMARLETAARRIELSRQTAEDLAQTAARLEASRPNRAARIRGALAASRDAEGETGAIQSSVQALGVLSEQLEGLQALMAAQSRLAAQEAAERAASKQEAIAARRAQWARKAQKPKAPAFNPLPNARQ
ncbi:conjugal transfer protein TrbJ [Aquidulcibacter sp.]|uniref:conjugal transfer protein TrbJ n=1 Tax=Aquidulcibacter sp. TaxID=2052990 RepID=UPI0025B9935C|nr:conjugal transfer protein TrbJ [Aquidulcibacter sp.]MCA3694785.1 conjugal transfer protein TrbJ [Aquidulcibacter sp.]